VSAMPPSKKGGPQHPKIFGLLPMHIRSDLERPNLAWSGQLKNEQHTLYYGEGHLFRGQSCPCHFICKCILQFVINSWVSCNHRDATEDMLLRNYRLVCNWDEEK